MREAIDCMRQAFLQLARGDVTLPTRVQLDAAPHSGVALVMSCHSAAEQMFSVKVATVFRDNPSRGLPRIYSTLQLTDGTTGRPVALMESAALTAIRTGAASGLATDLLAHPKAQTVAILGSGVQSRTQLEAVCCVRPIRLAKVYSRNAGSAARFAIEMGQQLQITVQPVDTAAAALDHAEIICTATPATAPLFADVDVADGAHLNAVGAFRPDMVEIPAATVARARVIVDHRAAALEEAGDLLQPLRAGTIDESWFQTELGDLLTGKVPAGHIADRVTLFKSVGVAIQDLCAARRAVENARRLGLGISLAGQVTQ